MSLSTLVVRKPLKRTDRLKRFAIPTKTLHLFPQFDGHRFVPVNFQQGPIIWPMVISTRTHGHKKPVISKGWIPFVRENQLEVGDVVTIFRDEHEAGIQYRIEIERGSKPLPALHGDLEEQQVPVFPSSNVDVGVPDSNVNVEVVATNILAVKQETPLAPANAPPIAQKAEELSLKPDYVNLGLTPMFACTLPFAVQEELKSTAGVQQQIALQTHRDDTKRTNLDPILNQTSADEFRLNLNLTLAPHVVACEGNQVPTMGLLGAEAENFNPRIVLNLDLTLTAPKVN